MQVEAIYDRGRLEFVTGLQLKHDRLRVIVTVPEEAVAAVAPNYNLPPEITERARTMREKLDAIRQAPPPPDATLPDLTEKQRERIAAFECREER